MKHRYLYSKLMYSMAYVCAVAILAFSYMGIPNDLLIAFAIACLVTGGYLTSMRQTISESPKRKIKLTTLEEEMREARRLEAAQR
ncbi:MAG: hypothetical protein JW700_00770 [Candidatus Aenigmarchaeota archaeon]|nr:hypothetical protein [Candidatus Aenigmarchaeota archaeon]